MASQGGATVNPEEFKLMAERAALGLTAAELEELRPLYEIYLSLSQKSNAAPNRPLWIPAFAGITRL